MKRFLAMAELDLVVEEECAEGIQAPEGLNARAVITAAMEKLGNSGGKRLSLRWIGAADSAKLNSVHRQKPVPTNVLAFPAAPMPGLPAHELVALGDLALCVPILESEAQQQGKTQQAHATHLLIHGLLHLLGYDHQTPADALRMEGLETNIISDLGFPDPYGNEWDISNHE